MRAWLLAIAACSSSPDKVVPDAPPPTSSRFELNDVSILFPLPADEAQRDRFLWLVPRDGERGPFFPIVHVNDLPKLNADVPDGFGYPSAMVTSLRYDHCPRTPCEPELRLVAQPVIVTGAQVQMLDDAAVHLFYRVDGPTVEAALAALRDRSPVSTAGRLRVHPALGRDDAAAFVTALHALVVDNCREDTLYRITASSFAFDNWEFAKFTFGHDAVTREWLDHLKSPSTSQAWLRQASQDDTSDPSGAIAPRPTAGFEYLLARASYTNLDPDRAKAAADTIARIEDPTATKIEDVDCVSCHVATQTRYFARRNGVTFESTFDAHGYDVSLEPAPEMDGNLSATIAFGWHHTKSEQVFPSISQRVVNETALVAHALSTR
jgi:hypothetical protein